MDVVQHMQHLFSQLAHDGTEGNWGCPGGMDTEN